MQNPTGRFSSRVEHYIATRPGYPPELMDLLETHYGLTPQSVVADIGSGTGILTQLLLAHGCRVLGVEPNPDMRAAGERLLAGSPRFESIAATAEETSLPDASIDFITAGQAFHWFDHLRARAEFARILRPGGWVALVWNVRRTSGSAFLQAYEQLLQEYGTDYDKITVTQYDRQAIDRFFAPIGYQLHTLSNQQRFDCAGLIGRLRSSSYTPEPSHPTYAPMIAATEAIFEQHQIDGMVAFEYDVDLYLGQLRG